MSRREALDALYVIKKDKLDFPNWGKPQFHDSRVVAAAVPRKICAGCERVHGRAWVEVMFKLGYEQAENLARLMKGQEL